jgi:hypothetical protein
VSFGSFSCPSRFNCDCSHGKGTHHHERKGAEKRDLEEELYARFFEELNERELDELDA